MYWLTLSLQNLLPLIFFFPSLLNFFLYSWIALILSAAGLFEGKEIKYRPTAGKHYYRKS